MAATIVLEDVTLVISATKVTWEHVELEAAGHTPCIDEGLGNRREDAGVLDGRNYLQPLDAETSKVVVGPKPPGKAAVHDLKRVLLPRVLPYKVCNQALRVAVIILEQPREGRCNFINKIKGFINVGEGRGGFKPVREAGVKPALFSKIHIKVSNLGQEVVEFMEMLRGDIGNSPLRSKPFAQQCVKVSGEVKNVLHPAEHSSSGSVTGSAQETLVKLTLKDEGVGGRGKQLVDVAEAGENMSIEFSDGTPHTKLKLFNHTSAHNDLIMNIIKTSTFRSWPNPNPEKLTS